MTVVTVWVVVQDCGLNGHLVLGVFGDHADAMAASRDPDLAVPCTGYSGTEVHEAHLEIEETP